MKNEDLIATDQLKPDDKHQSSSLWQLALFYALFATCSTIALILLRGKRNFTSAKDVYTPLGSYPSLYNINEVDTSLSIVFSHVVTIVEIVIVILITNILFNKVGLTFLTALNVILGFSAILITLIRDNSQYIDGFNTISNNFLMYLGFTFYEVLSTTKETLHLLFCSLVTVTLTKYYSPFVLAVKKGCLVALLYLTALNITLSVFGSRLPSISVVLWLLPYIRHFTTILLFASFGYDLEMFHFQISFNKNDS